MQALIFSSASAGSTFSQPKTKKRKRGKDKARQRQEDLQAGKISHKSLQLHLAAAIRLGKLFVLIAAKSCKKQWRGENNNLYNCHERLPLANAYKHAFTAVKPTGWQLCSRSTSSPRTGGRAVRDGAWWGPLAFTDLWKCDLEALSPAMCCKWMPFVKGFLFFFTRTKDWYEVMAKEPHADQREAKALHLLCENLVLTLPAFLPRYSQDKNKWQFWLAEGWLFNAFWLEMLCALE